MRFAPCVARGGLKITLRFSNRCCRGSSNHERHTPPRTAICGAGNSHDRTAQTCVRPRFRDRRPIEISDGTDECRAKTRRPCISSRPGRHSMRICRAALRQAAILSATPGQTIWCFAQVIEAVRNGRAVPLRTRIDEPHAPPRSRGSTRSLVRGGAHRALPPDLSLRGSPLHGPAGGPPPPLRCATLR